MSSRQDLQRFVYNCFGRAAPRGEPSETPVDPAVTGEAPKVQFILSCSIYFVFFLFFIFTLWLCRTVLLLGGNGNGKRRKQEAILVENGGGTSSSYIAIRTILGLPEVPAKVQTVGAEQKVVAGCPSSLRWGR